MDPAEELVRIQVLLLKRDALSQSALILEMNSVGFSNSRIAELLGTTPNTVTVTIAKAKARAKAT
jgi:DNA-binding NarL/FixJ family response regulator